MKPNKSPFRTNIIWGMVRKFPNRACLVEGFHGVSKNNMGGLCLNSIVISPRFPRPSPPSLPAPAAPAALAAPAAPDAPDAPAALAALAAAGFC